MIARHWTGRVRAEDAIDYANYVRRTGIAAHRATVGNLGSMVLVRIEQTEAEVVVISLWESLDAVRAFAGDDPETAVFFAEDERYLVSADRRVKHYEVPAHEIPVSIVRGTR
jgi:heme-degrading monooxygenase HmoA